MAEDKVQELSGRSVVTGSNQPYVRSFSFGIFPEQSFFLHYRFQMPRHRRGGIDYLNPRACKSLDDIPEDRVVGTSEYYPVSPGVK